MQPGRQFDLLVHDMKGREPDSYGLICSKHDGQSGDIDGRMVYYKYNDNHSQVEFAFALPLQVPLKGEQFVSFNTYQPSLDSKDAANPVANWIQISNTSSKQQKGTLYFYSIDGKQLGTDISVTLGAGARRDISGHQFGASRVGLVRWRPDDSTAEFQLRNVRYVYDNNQGLNHFTTAFQLEGLKGSGELLSAPLDTKDGSSIVELLNTSREAIKVATMVYNNSGHLLRSMDIKLNAHASFHLITDQILNGEEGIVMLKSNVANSLIATVMQYGRTPSAGINYMYGILAKPAVGSMMRGTYNTFLDQGCNLLLTNPGESKQDVKVSMVRYDGKKPVSDFSVQVPAHGMYNQNICSKDSPNVYGVVTVTPNKSNSIYATIVRLGKNNEYRFPTLVR